jgi:nucleotide-binding universal stress UspA family protein
VNAREHEIIIRRILVALDASPHSEAALDAAAQLAARVSAELEGLFIEDINLLRLAELPFAREVGFFTAAGRRLDTRELERQLRAQARRVHARLTAIAERDRLQWSFRVTRGAIATELLEASSGADLVILGRSGWSPRRGGRLGSTARTLAFGAPTLTLVLQKGTCLGLPVLAVYDGSPLSEKALAAAAFLARQEEGPVTVILVDDGPEARALRQQATDQLDERGVQARFRKLERSNVRWLARLVREEGCGTLVLPAKSTLLQEEALLALVDEIDAPVLFVR